MVACGRSLIAPYLEVAPMQLNWESLISIRLIAEVAATRKAGLCSDIGVANKCVCRG